MYGGLFPARLFASYRARCAATHLMKMYEAAAVVTAFCIRFFTQG